MISRQFSRFFPDLTLYETDSRVILPEVLNIGWLSPLKPFTTGDVSNDFINKLNKLLKNSNSSNARVVMGIWRGTFTCPLCGISNWEIHKRIPHIGNAEIWIPSAVRKSMYYSSSTWISHYILDHKYLPPDEYIKSVLFFDEEETINANLIAFDLETKYQALKNGVPIDQNFVDHMHKILEI
jgi:hypothetical protein